MAATREFIESVGPEDMASSVGNVRIDDDHFEQALTEVTPSVTAETKERYDEIEDRFDSGEPATEEREVGRTFQ